MASALDMVVVPFVSISYPVMYKLIKLLWEEGQSFDLSQSLRGQVFTAKKICNNIRISFRLYPVNLQLGKEYL